MANIALIISVVVAVLAVALGGAYFAGMLDPLVAPIVKYMFVAKARAQQKALEAQGKKEGEDFVKEQLAGNQQASEIANQGLQGLKNL
ncbi:MAG: hypothetical protein M1817_006245 [Caeruleum heppii]|nr:MAG: hypothetical protein M1817_006245 [Caeruleum heppii]